VLVGSDGTQVQFTAPASSHADQYLPSLVTQPGTGQSTGYVYSGGKLVQVVEPDPNVSASTQTTTAYPYPASSSTWTAGAAGCS
jgi:hypothetical protein